MRTRMSSMLDRPRDPSEGNWLDLVLGTEEVIQEPLSFVLGGYIFVLRRNKFFA